MANAITRDQLGDIDLRKAWLPGIYYGLTFREYGSLPYLNVSKLGTGLISAKHLKNAIDGPYKHKDSDALLFGRAFHARLLEPDVYNKEYLISPGCQQVMGAKSKSAGLLCGNRAKYLYRGEWLCGTHIPKSDLIDPQQNVLTMDDHRRVEGAAASIQQNSVVRLLKHRGGFETTILFEWEGEKCKARLDKWIPGTAHWPATILDLKKVQVGKCTEDAVEKSILDYAYDVKQAFYRTGIEVLTGVRPEFIWPFVEDDDPFDVNVIRCDRDTDLIGMLRLSECMSRYKIGMAHNDWPGVMGHNNKPKLGGLPRWYRHRYLGS